MKNGEKVWSMAVLAVPALAAAVLAGAGCPARPAGTAPGSQPAEDPHATLVALVRRHVHDLSVGIGVRDHAHVAEANAAARYLKAEFRAVGVGVGAGSVTVQSYDVQGATHYNVCLEITGAATPGEVVVVGAHYDTAPGTPGADDNASGVAGVLALARRFAARPPPRTVRLVAFGTEEPPYIRTPHMGSYHYARMCRERGDNIVAMISLEMIGYYSDAPGSQKVPLGLKGFPTVGNYLVFVGDTSSRKLVTRARELFTAHGRIPSEIWVMPRITRGVNSSDQWSFWQWQYPGIMVTDTANWRNPNYHQPRDTPETLDCERMARAVEGLELVVREWAGETIAPAPTPHAPPSTGPVTGPAREDRVALPPTSLHGRERS